MLEAVENLGIDKPDSDEEPDHNQNETEQERNSPSERKEGTWTIDLADQIEHGRRQQHAGRGTELSKAAEQSAPARRCMLHRQHGGATPFGANGNPLQHTQSRQQCRCHQPRFRIGRQRANRGRNQTHRQQCAHQNRLTPQPVPEVSRHNRTDRPGTEPGGVGGERGQSPGG